MNGNESAKRLALVERAFRTIADCAQQIAESEVEVNREALSAALGTIGSRLMQAAEQGPDWERRQLNHWAEHGHEATKQLVERGKYQGAITADLFRVIFRSAPPPEP